MISERDIVYITKKQASIATAMLVVLCMLIFVLGYFWGKRSVTDDFGQKIAQDSAQDKVDYLMTMQSFMEKTKQDASPIQSDSSLLDDNSVDEKRDDQDLVNDKNSANKNEQTTLSISKNDIEKVNKNKSVEKMYYAKLIGFGTRAAAQSFKNRLQKQEIPVEIKTRVSKTASGKVTRTWYQAITKSYKSKEELQELVHKIKKLERIKDHDIKII